MQQTDWCLWIKGQTFECELRCGEQVRKPPGTGRKGREALTFWESGFCAASALGFASIKTEGLLVDGGRGPPGWGAGKGNTHMRTGLMAFLMLPKAARPSSSRRHLSASSAGFSFSFSGAWRGEGDRLWKHTARG